MNKLKTPLGKPQETFLALEGILLLLDFQNRIFWNFILETLRFFAWPIDNNNNNNTKRTDTPSSSEQVNPAVMSSSSGDINMSADKGDWWCDLHRCGLLLQLIEALEKCMYNAYEGAALSLPQLPKVGFIFQFIQSYHCFF